jgi:hypothetical protein
MHVVRRVVADQRYAHSIARRYDDSVFFINLVGGQRLRDEEVQAADDARLWLGITQTYLTELAGSQCPNSCLAKSLRAGD